MTYFDYYRHTLEQHPFGLKLVQGGTGLGKTSAIPEVVLFPDYQQRKFIYAANRIQLVEEMAHEFDKRKASAHCVVLARDLEVVRITLQKYRQEFYAFLEDPHFTESIYRWNDRTPLKRIDLSAVKRVCKTLEELFTEHIITLPRALEEQIDSYARQILEAFKAALLGANINGRGNNLTYLKLADHPIVQSLFPCIAFKRHPEIRIMLVTLQKAFYGFFDGQKTLNLTRLEDEDGGYVIFLDEFDFLENDLVRLICRSPQISNPFRIVELFYRAMVNHKLPSPDYPRSNNIRNRITAIKAIVDELRDKDQLNFPDINQFTSMLPHRSTFGTRKQGEKARTSPTIFRTSHTISTDQLYLHQTNRSFEITSDPGSMPYPALRLFDAVSRACESILYLFKELERGNDEITYRELIRHCFQDTVFPEELRHIAQFSHSHDQAQTTSLSALLETGYSLYDIHDLQQRTDTEEVEVCHYGIHTTPERILCSLARHNLVFGLSATADIERFVHHFNLDWLKQQVLYIDVDEHDKNIIHILNEEKAKIRANQIEVTVLEDLDPNDDYQHRLGRFLDEVTKDEDFGDDTHEGHLKRRTQLFFASLLWICAHPSKERGTYLLFLNTFKQIKLIFDRYRSPDEGLFEITARESNKWFQVYEITLREQHFIVVFYNAQMGNMVRQNREAEQDFDKLFWEGKPVIVATQYLSAGNGVNLQYWSSPEKERKQDFTHIGLLEAPYFYFGKPETDLPWEEKIALLKENIWYQAKLYTGNVISEPRFLQILSTLNDPWEWNRRYQGDKNTRSDALFNHMATFIQALGRIERVWQPMPDQMVLLSSEVHAHFQRYCTSEFDQLRQEREQIISSNLRQVFQQISGELPELERAMRRQKDARLGAKDEQCQQAIQHLLVRLERLRQGSNDQEARTEWQHLRQAALQHHFDDALLLRYYCVAESPYYHNGLLYLTEQKEILPAQLARRVQAHSYPWRMDAVYGLIRDNLIIREHFQAHGYKLAFDPGSQQFFTPYCYQAILTGAIGEEAITALLQGEGIELEAIPDPLFEVADLKIRGLPWYVDCKNYNEYTLDRFNLSPDDPAWHPKLNTNHFTNNAQRKVERLQSYHGTPVKLIYLNLVSNQQRSRGYYTDNFQKASFANASIIVIQGTLQRRFPNAYQQAYDYFLNDLRSAYEHVIN